MADRARLIVLNLIGTAGVGAAWASGQADLVFVHDETRLSLGLAILLLFGIVAAFAGCWRAVRWIAGTLALLGMLATVWGFILLGQTISGTPGSSEAMRSVIVRGIPNGLAGTLVGFLGYLWLRTVAFLCHEGEDI